MYTSFEDLNAYIYHSAQVVLLDGVIWCLGPYVDDSRGYGRFRIYLAQLTRLIVRSCCLAASQR